MITATYIGSMASLKGKTALLREESPPLIYTVYVQFDDLDSEYGHGWHLFPRRDFIPQLPEDEL